LSTIDRVHRASEAYNSLRNQFEDDGQPSAGDPSGGGQIETWVPPVCARGDRNPKFFTPASRLPCWTAGKPLHCAVSIGIKKMACLRQNGGHHRFRCV